MKKLPFVLGAVAIVAGVIVINQKSTKSDQNRLASSLPAETPFYCEATNLEKQFTEFEKSPEYKEFAKIDLAATIDAFAKLTDAPVGEAQMIKGVVDSSLPEIMSGVSFLRKMVGDKLELAYLPLSMAKFDKGSSEETMVKELLKLIVIRSTSSIKPLDIEGKLIEIKAKYKAYNSAPFTGWEFVLDKRSQTSLFLVRNNSTYYLTIDPTVLASTIETPKGKDAKTLATSADFVAAEKLAIDEKTAFANINLQKLADSVKNIMTKFEVPEHLAKSTCEKFTQDFTNIFVSSHQDSSRGTDRMTATSNKKYHKLLQNIVTKNELSLQNICPKDSVFFANGHHINCKELFLRELAGSPGSDEIYSMVNQQATTEMGVSLDKLLMAFSGEIAIMGREMALNAIIPKIELALVSEINDKASVEIAVKHLMELLSEELEGNPMLVLGKELIGDATAYTLTAAMMGLKVTIAINDKFVVLGTFDYVKEVLNTAKADSIATHPSVKKILDSNKDLTKLTYFDIQTAMVKTEALIDNVKNLAAGIPGDKGKHINVIDQKFIRPLINVFKVSKEISSFAYLTEDGIIQESTCTRK